MTDIHDTADLVSKALRRAWQLGQTYWQQADSEYQSHWKKADATQATFDQLVEDTRAAILTSNSGTQPAPSVPEGWQLVPTAESRHPGIYKMLGALHAADNTPGMSEWESYRAMLAAAPEVKS